MRRSSKSERYAISNVRLFNIFLKVLPGVKIIRAFLTLALTSSLVSWPSLLMLILKEPKSPSLTILPFLNSRLITSNKL